jgi:hypothetical protein
MKQTTKQSNNATPIVTATASREGALQPTEQSIRERAYAIHESHGDASRNPTLDWLDAEQQLRSESKIVNKGQQR